MRSASSHSIQSPFRCRILALGTVDERTTVFAVAEAPKQLLDVDCGLMAKRQAPSRDRGSTYIDPIHYDATAHHFWVEQFHARMLPNNARRLSGKEWRWAATRA